MFVFFKKKKGLEKAKDNLKKDFGLLLSNAPDPNSIIKPFNEMVCRSGVRLSDNAQTALLYRLYCMNFLAVSKIMRDGGEKINVEDLLWIPDVLNRSIDYAEKASDYIHLETMSGHLNQNIESFLASFGINRG